MRGPWSSDGIPIEARQKVSVRIVQASGQTQTFPKVQFGVAQLEPKGSGGLLLPATPGYLAFLETLGPLHLWNMEETSGTTVEDDGTGSPARPLLMLRDTNLDIDGFIGSGLEFLAGAGVGEGGWAVSSDGDDAASLSTSTPEDCTFVVPVRFDAELGESSLRVIFQLGQPEGSSSISSTVYLDRTGVLVAYQNNPGSGDFDPTVVGTTLVTDGNWHQLAVQFTRTGTGSGDTGTAKVWLDGQVELDGATEAGGGGYLYLGATRRGFAGVGSAEASRRMEQDVVAVFDGYLTDDEIASLWASFSADL